MIYWIHTPVQAGIGFSGAVFHGVRCVVSGGGTEGEDHEDSFTAYGCKDFSFTDVVDVPPRRVKDFESFLARVQAEGLVLEIVGKSE